MSQSRESLEIRMSELLRENLALRSRIMELESRLKMLAKAWVDETTPKTRRITVSATAVERENGTDVRPCILCGRSLRWYTRCDNGGADESTWAETVETGNNHAEPGECTLSRSPIIMVRKEV
jgi:hypothetical protein